MKAIKFFNKLKFSILVLSMLVILGLLKAQDNLRDLNDYVGRYSFEYENNSMDDVKLEIANDSTLKVEANIGSATLIFKKEDEFKIFEYDGRVIFLRDSTAQKVIGVKVIVPNLDIETEGKKVE